MVDFGYEFESADFDILNDVVLKNYESKAKQWKDKTNNDENGVAMKSLVNLTQCERSELCQFWVMC